MFAVGQYVELYPTIPSPTGDRSIDSGTRGIVQATEDYGDDGVLYLVGFLINERLTGEAAWLEADDLFAA